MILIGFTYKRYSTLVNALEEYDSKDEDLNLLRANGYKPNKREIPAIAVSNYDGDV